MPQCPKCDATIEAEQRFCHECGARLEEAPPETGEHKQVTAVFGDVVGSTALAEQIGAEEMHGLLDRFFSLTSQAIAAYGGTINKFLGDGFLAIFGLPVAYEDHAQRAVFASLDLQRRIAKEWPSHHVPCLRARIGINSGTVVVGRLGSGAESDLTAIGDTTNVASRLESLAQPGEVLISDSTAALVRGYVTVEAVGDLALKGRDEPTLTHRATGRGERRTRADDPARRLSPFVGRERQIGSLADLLGEVREGRGQIVGIVGEPGMGKTRLVTEFRRRHSPTTSFHEGRCLSYGADTPLVPFADLLRSWADITQADSSELVVERLRDLLESRRLDPERWLYLGSVVGLGAAAEGLADLSPEAVRERVFSTLNDLLLAEASRGSTVVVIEDLHWMDDVSRDFLEHLADEIQGASMMVLCTYRPGYQAGWTQRSYATQLALPRLTPTDALEIARSLAPARTLTDQAIDAIRLRAEGNPFFVEELARALTENEAATEAPTGVHDVLLARIDSLDPDAKELLRTAAVLGRECSLEVLERMWEGSAHLDVTIDTLKHNEFVYESDLAGQRSLVFKHALTQDVAYGGLLSRTRRELHGKAGEVIEETFAGRLEEVYASLGHHYSEAAKPDAAVRFLSLAAERSLSGYANQAAATALERALALVDQCTEEDRAALALHLIFRLGFTYYLLGRFEPALQLFIDHEWRLQEVGDRDDLVAEFLFWQAYFETHLGISGYAEQHARDAIEIADRNDDHFTAGRAYYVLTREDFWLCRYPDGVEHGRTACELLEQTDQWWWLGHASAWQGLNHYSMGEFDAALHAAGRMNAIGTERHDPRLESYSDWNAGWFEATRGNWEVGVAYAEKSLARSPDPLNSAYSTGWLGFAYREKGDYARATTLLEESIERLEEFGYSRLVGWFSGWLADAYLWAGRLTRAESASAKALQVSQDVEYPWAVSLARRSQGRIAMANEDEVVARRLLLAACEEFDGMLAYFEAAVTRLDIARLRGGDEAEQVTFALKVFERTNAPRYVDKARSLAVELGVDAHDQSPGAAA